MNDAETIAAFAKAFNISLVEHEAATPAVDENWKLGGLELYPLPNGRWDVCRGVVIPGKGRTLNDPGDPDDYDLVDIISDATLWDALAVVGVAIINDWVDGARMAADVGEDSIPF